MARFGAVQGRAWGICTGGFDKVRVLCFVFCVHVMIMIMIRGQSLVQYSTTRVGTIMFRIDRSWYWVGFELGVRVCLECLPC